MTSSVIAGLGLSALFLVLLLRKMLKKKISVKSKVVLITGASSGLGEACSHVFYKAGAKVILSARRKEELLRVKQDMLTSTASIEASTHEPQVLVMDLADLKSIPELSKKAISLYGRVDIVVNNGGISYRGEAIHTSIDVDQHVMMVNYFGQVALTKAIIPHMIQNKTGHIVGVSSIQGKIAIPHRSSYAASKHAFQAFLDSLRAEVSNSGVKVTCISPAYIKTNLSINAITGTGNKYGEVDKTTASGMSPVYVAKSILEAVQYEQNEIILGSIVPIKLAIWIRFFFPSVYFWLMKRRAKKKQD